MNHLQVSDRWLRQCQGTWLDILQETVRQYPQDRAVVFRDQEITYAELWRRVNEVAKALYAIGVRSGDHIGLWMVNRPECLYARYAIYRLGAVIVPLHTRFKTTELECVLSQSDCRYLVMEDNFLGNIDAMGMLSSITPEIVNCPSGALKLARFPKLKGVICMGSKTHPGCYSWEEALVLGREIPEADIETRIEPDDVSQIMYTSGTTGFPKGAIQTYRNNIACFSMTSELVGIRRGDNMLCVPPFSGNIGLWLSCVCVLEGATAILDDVFEPERTMRLIQAQRISHILLLGPMAISMLEHPAFGRYDLSSVKWIFYGIGFRKTGYQLRDAFPNATFCNGYGLVEGSGLQTFVPRDATIEQVVESVGVPLPYCEQAILDLNTGRILGTGEEGEICTRELFPGTHFMKGYYKQPELTIGAIKDGWLHSGDLGKMDSAGFTYLTGRLKEMLKVGGFNIAPAEVEEVLMKHPAVAQVAVVGVPDHRLTEVPVAFVILKRGQNINSAQIIDYCKDKLANIRVPRHVFISTEFPMTPQSKVKKFKLREQAIKELGLEDLASTR